jgi:hypothetical protein
MKNSVNEIGTDGKIIPTHIKLRPLKNKNSQLVFIIYILIF